jgi:hypothetical protein
VVVANDDGHIGFGLIQILAKLAHGGNIGVELSKVFTRRADKELRRVDRSECCYDFAHVRFLIFIEARAICFRSFHLKLRAN